MVITSKPELVVLPNILLVEKIYLLEFDAQLVVDLKTSVSRADRLLPMAKDSEKLMSLLLALLANPNGPDHYVYFIL